MKYILADKNKGKFTVNYITTDPVVEVSKFEPIDVVNGGLLAWDIDGNLYHFSSSSETDAPNMTSFLKPVNVGIWNQGEPIMTKVAEGREDDLRQALVDYLQSPSQGRLRLQLLNSKHKAQLQHIDYSKTTLEELVEYVEKRLKSDK